MRIGRRCRLVDALAIERDGLARALVGEAPEPAPWLALDARGGGRPRWVRGEAVRIGGRRDRRRRSRPTTVAGWSGRGTDGNRDEACATTRRRRTVLARWSRRSGSPGARASPEKDTAGVACWRPSLASAPVCHGTRPGLTARALCHLVELESVRAYSSRPSTQLMVAAGLARSKFTTRPPATRRSRRARWVPARPPGVNVHAGAGRRRARGDRDPG
jgi:hypothetical protein